MRFATSMFVVLLAGIAFGQVQRGAPLARKGFFGLQTIQADKGIRIARVVPGGLGERLGLKEGDIVLEANGTKELTPTKLAVLARAIDSGAKVAIKYLRDGQEKTAEAPMPERPRVVEPNMDVIYDQVLNHGQRVRIIITKPKSDGKFPALFLIGGIGAYSVDAPFASMAYGKQLGAAANAGYVTVRIDKPGQGDSEGPEYKSLAFGIEKDAYVAALRLVKTLPYIDKDRIAIFGHSMGGCFGPLVASEEPVKGLFVCGTLFKTWNEYMLENTRRQSELSSPDAGALDESLRNLAALNHYIFDRGMNPAEVQKERPDLAAFVRGTFPDGETYSGVGIPFFRELSRINLPRAWAGAKTSVAVIYCENDFLSGQDDHERIAKFVNSLRPGTAEFILLRQSDHIFSKTSSMRDSMDKWGKGGEFNTSILDTLLDFLKRKV